jgi:hypothetical protein
MILHAFYFVCHSFDSFTLNFNNISFAQVWRITTVLLSFTLSTQPPLGEVMTHNILHSLRSSFISYLSLYYWSISKRTIYHPSSIRWFHINKGFSFASVANQDVDILNVLVWMISHNVDVDDLLVKIVLINGYYWGYFWHLVFEKQALLMKNAQWGRCTVYSLALYYYHFINEYKLTWKQSDINPGQISWWRRIPWHWRGARQACASTSHITPEYCSKKSLDISNIRAL